MKINFEKAVSYIGTLAHRSIKPIFISVMGLVIVFGILFSWKSTRSGPPARTVQPPMPVSALRVQGRSVPAEIQAIGSLQAVQEVLLAPDTAGRITGIYFEAGCVVKEGTPLVQLYDAPEQADRAAAVAKADFSRLQLSRSRDSPLLAPNRVNYWSSVRLNMTRLWRRCTSWMHAFNRNRSVRRSPGRLVFAVSIWGNTSMRATRLRR